MKISKITKKAFNTQTAVQMATLTTDTYFNLSSDIHKKYADVENHPASDLVITSYPCREYAEKIAFCTLTGVWLETEELASFWNGHLSITKGETIFVKYGKNMVL